MEAMPKTIERTLSGSEMAPPFHRTSRISLNYCAAYFFRKDGVCVALEYFFPGRVRRLFLPGTLYVRSKHVNDTVRYGNFFLTPTVCTYQLHTKQKKKWRQSELLKLPIAECKMLTWRTKRKQPFLRIGGIRRNGYQSFSLMISYQKIIREYGSTLYVGLARAVSPTNTNFRLTFLLTRLQEALYEDLAV